MQIPVAPNIESWIFSINPELMAYSIGQVAVAKLRQKLSIKTGMYHIHDFMVNMCSFIIGELKRTVFLWKIINS